ncbi:hypothetical protein AKJ09_09547 [Labilithrix luteola]|uniref:BON domain-containing protein n=1 Tax=Labilithrix luteola TaxID=1391654 RepID=A0A0K1QAX0_9BACT|nr:hypothetical protein AKJ09_09547 [Labilithrix luteola]
MLALLAGAAVLYAVDARVARRRQRERILSRALRHLQRTAVPDATVEGRVLERLARLVPHGGISATTERSCVILTGEVSTQKRAHVVRSIARVEGVDSVVDLMTERRQGVSDDGPTWRRAPTAARGWQLAPSDRSPASRTMIGGVGAGLALAGLRLRGFVGPTLALVGCMLLVRSALNVELRRRPLPNLPRRLPSPVTETLEQRDRRHGAAASVW